jgi:hypothetical protein
MKILLPENFPNPRRKGTAAAPPKYKGGAALRCCPPLFCHGFCKPTHMQHIYFLKEKNKRAAPTVPTKTHAKKNEGS